MPGLDIVTNPTALEMNPKFIISNILRSVPTDHKVSCIIDKRVQPNGLVSYLAKMCAVKSCAADNLYHWVSLEGLGDEWSMLIEQFEHETSVKALSSQSSGPPPSSYYSMTREELEQNGLIDPEQEQELQRLQQASQKAKRKKLLEKQKQDRLNDTKSSGDLRKLRSRNSSSDEVDELIKRKRGRPKKRQSSSSDQEFDSTDSFPSGHVVNKNDTEEQQQAQEHRPQKPEKSLEPAKQELAVAPEIRLPSIKLLDNVQSTGGLVTVAPAATAQTVSTSSGIYPRHSPYHFYNVSYYQKPPMHHQVISCSGCGSSTSPDQFKYNGWAQTSNGLYYCKPCQCTRPPLQPHQQHPQPSRLGGAGVQRHLLK